MNGTTYITSRVCGWVTVVGMAADSSAVAAVLAEARAIYKNAGRLSAASIAGDMPRIGDTLYSDADDKFRVNYSY